MTNAEMILERNRHTMLTEVSVLADWTQTDVGVSVLSNAASTVLTSRLVTDIRTAVAYSTRHTNRSI